MENVELKTMEREASAINKEELENRMQRLGRTVGRLYDVGVHTSVWQQSGEWVGNLTFSPETVDYAAEDVVVFFKGGEPDTISLHYTQEKANVTKAVYTEEMPQSAMGVYLGLFIQEMKNEYDRED